MKENREELLRKFIDAELDARQEREALHIIADDPALRGMLRFDRYLAEELRTDAVPDASRHVPEAFADTVMSRINKLEQEKAKAETQSKAPEKRDYEREVLDKLTGLFERMLTPRAVSFRPIYALSVLLLIGGWALFGPDRSGETPSGELAEISTQVVSEEGSEVWVRFVHVDRQAETMAVAGDFSGWEPVELSREEIGGQQVWTAMIRVERGEHHYMFIRDGEEWMTDPFATVRRDDGFGNENAVIYL